MRVEDVMILRNEIFSLKEDFFKKESLKESLFVAQSIYSIIDGFLHKSNIKDLDEEVAREIKIRFYAVMGECGLSSGLCLMYDPHFLRAKFRTRLKEVYLKHNLPFKHKMYRGNEGLNNIDTVFEDMRKSCMIRLELIKMML